MAEYTDDFGFLKLGAGDTLATDNYKFGTSDRELIAQLLRLGAETHHHNAALAATSGLDVGARSLTLTLAQDAGAIPAGVRAYYEFSLVVDGFESEVSTVYTVDTPAPIPSPAAPTLATATTGGALLPGSYYYILTAWVTSNTLETKGINAATISVPAGTGTNTITLTYPALPSGADGWNIYRKQPSGVRYDFLTSIEVGATPGTTFIDTDAIAEDCNRTLPTINYTNRQNHVTVDLVGDPLDPGVTWRIYRTYASGDFQDSRIASVASGTTFDDLGVAGSGSPPGVAIEVASPSKILLTDAAEVSGRMPLGMVAFPQLVNFSFPGPLAVTQGSGIWLCEFPYAEVVSCRASLGRGYAPASFQVIVDVNKGPSSATPTFSTIYTTQADRPRIQIGQQIGARATPAVTSLARGDVLSVDVDQIGGGATPTDRDLTVTILVIAYGYPITTSYIEGASGGAGGLY